MGLSNQILFAIAASVLRMKFSLNMRNFIVVVFFLQVTNKYKKKLNGRKLTGLTGRQPFPLHARDTHTRKSLFSCEDAH